MNSGEQRPTYAVGIDLGTTNSAAAVVTDAGSTTMLADELGEVLTPSVVHFADEEVIVGRDACQAILFDADSVADAAKRDIGREFFSRPIRGKSFPPEVIEAYVLKHVKQIVENGLPGGSGTPDYRVVITVPAFFDERRRRATANAGQMAGLNVLDIVNEPTAAALAFGEHLGYLSTTGSVQKEQRVLVFDLGGGTFDVTIIELRPNAFVTLATDGDVRLGGTDWDKRLADYLAQKFESQYRLDPRNDRTMLQRLRRLAEEAKHSLTARRHKLVMVEFGGRKAEVNVSREQFEGLTADLVERTVHTTQDLLRQAGVTWQEIDRLLLVGGSTRMPMIARRLQELAGKVPEQSVNPDEAVARGAAIYASYLLAKKGLSGHQLSFRVVDVNAHSLGVEGVDVTTNRKQNSIVIPKNSPLPAQVTRPFVTRQSNQPSIVLKVLEGESQEPGDCITIGQAVLRDLPKNLPEQHPLEVTFAYASNGRLKILMDVPGTDRQLLLELQRGDMSDLNVKQWSQIVALSGGFRSFEEMLKAVLEVKT